MEKQKNIINHSVASALAIYCLDDIFVRGQAIAEKRLIRSRIIEVILNLVKDFDLIQEKTKNEQELLLKEKAVLIKENNYLKTILDNWESFRTDYYSQREIIAVKNSHIDSLSKIIKVANKEINKLKVENDYLFNKIKENK